MHADPETAHTDDSYIHDLPVDREAITTNHKGVYRKGIEKRQAKLLAKVTFLRHFLDEDERILLITTGCSPMPIVEQLLTGWILSYLKRCLFVFTNKRIFHIPTRGDYSYRGSVAHIVYADCKSVRIRGRTLVVRYVSGGKDKFLYLGGKEKKKIRGLLAAISFGQPSGEALGRVHLCPRCASELEAGNYTCRNCQLEFKSKAEARKIAILYPGGGYFYTHHPILGLGDAIVETIFLLAVVVALVDLVSGAESAVADLLFFAVLLAVEKSISVYHTDRFIEEYIPKKRLASEHVVPQDTLIAADRRRE